MPTKTDNEKWFRSILGIRNKYKLRYKQIEKAKKKISKHQDGDCKQTKKLNKVVVDRKY